MRVLNINDYIDRFNKFFELCSVLLLFLVITAVSTQVFFRYILKNPLIWIEEITRILFIWMIFIGSAVAHKKVLHPRVDFFIQRIFPKKITIFFKMFTEMYILTFLIIMFTFGMKLAMNLKFISMSTTGLSLLYLYISIPIAAFIMLINQIYFILNRIFFKEFS